MKKALITSLLILYSCSLATSQPTISITFDDGITTDYPGYPFEKWNKMLLDKLDLDHLYDRAQFYEKLSYELTGRHVRHTLLLHHNVAVALFIDDLINMFEDKGWKVISADEAYTDPIFKKEPHHAGESLIWALAKDSGKFEKVLRYPAEDSKYEEAKMDRLGL